MASNCRRYLAPRADRLWEERSGGSALGDGAAGRPEQERGRYQALSGPAWEIRGSGSFDGSLY
jgi:hypothetical protein